MKVCLLTQREVGRFVNHGIMPDHAEHTHMPLCEALDKLKHDLLRVIAIGSRECVVEPASNCYQWIPKMSGGFTTLQFTRR